jgi:hypothetical protein
MFRVPLDPKPGMLVFNHTAAPAPFILQLAQALSDVGFHCNRIVMALWK